MKSASSDTKQLSRLHRAFTNKAKQFLTDVSGNKPHSLKPRIIDPSSLALFKLDGRANVDSAITALSENFGDPKVGLLSKSTKKGLIRGRRYVWRLGRTARRIVLSVYSDGTKTLAARQ